MKQKRTTSTKSAKFISLCAGHTDMDLLNALEHAIDDHYGFEKVLSDGAGGFHERLFWMLWKSQTYIDNEGLEQFLGLAGDRKFLGEGLAFFGFKLESDFLIRFVQHVSDPCAYVEWQEVRRILGILFDKEEAFEEMESQFFSMSKDLYEQLSRFVRAHLSSFQHLPLRAAETYPIPDIGYLPSFLLWIEKFAVDNGNRIPTFTELKRFVGQKHPGIAAATEDEYDIVQSNSFSSLPADAVIVKFRKPVLGKYYSILADERIVASLD